MIVIAHRGANRFAPQNTIQAFKKAIELRSDGIETDIHLTKDGHLVLCHDASVNRTSNGKGKISELLLSELRELDFGSWFGSHFRETRIPTIDEFLQSVKDSALKVLDLELKPQKNNSGLVKALLDKVREYDLTDRLFISSFDPKLLAEVKRINPKIQTGYLYPAMGDIVKRKLISPVKLAEKYQFDYLLPHQGYVSREIIQKAHNAGLKVAVWTVNKLDMADKLIRWGADGIITDLPDIMQNKVETF